MKYLIAGLLALAATSADAARYLEIKFRVSGADVDVVMDTQSPDVSGFNLPPYSNPEYYEASLDSGHLYFLDIRTAIMTYSGSWTLRDTISLHRHFIIRSEKPAIGTPSRVRMI